MTTPGQTPDRPSDADNPLADAQFEAALTGSPLPDTPSSILEMAAAARMAMTELDTVRSPTNDEVAEAWRQVLQQHVAAHPGPSWRDRLRQLVGSPRVLAPALAMATVVGLSVVAWQYQAEGEWSEVGLKGAPATVTVPDADAPTPAIVAELQALGLQPRLTPAAEGTLVRVPWPAMATEAQRQWLARYRLPDPREGTLTLLLVKRQP